MVKKISWFIILGALFLIPAVSFAATIQLPQTGQTKCYDTAGTEISCAGTGQDGENRVGVAWPDPRFSITFCDANGPCANQSADCDNYSSTDVVTDNLTGLMWTRDGWNLLSDWSTVINSANNLTLCGYSDWRLPNVNELESLTNANEPNPATWLNTQGFSNVQFFPQYFSSTTNAVSPYHAWSVGMRVGSVWQYEKNNEDGFAWPVRAGQSGSPDPLYTANIWKTGQTTSYATGDDGDMEKGVAWPNPRFSDQDNGTVADNLTGLIWTKNANAPGPSICTPGTYKTWQEALDYVACLNTNSYLDYDDWRLPNHKELRSLIDYSQNSPALPSGHPFVGVQSDDNCFYWSSTTWMPNSETDLAWIVSMGVGTDELDNKGTPLYYNYVWPVRAGQVGSFGKLKVDPASYDFGNVIVGISSTPQTFTITNKGTADLHISDMSLSDISNYSLDVNGGSSPCASTTPTIAPSSSCTVTITFSPSSEGIKDANLTISSDNPYTPTWNVPLSGTGIKVVITILAPNGGEIIPSGSVYTIQWVTSPEAAKFGLLYSMNNGTTWKSIVNKVTGNSYNWTVPKPLNNKKKCLVKVIGYSESDVKIGEDISDATFTIEVIKVDSPNGGEVLTSGTIHTITWQINGTSKPVGKIQLFFTKDSGATWKPIATVLGNLRSYNWKVPTVARIKKLCKAKVVISDTITYDISDRWFIIQP